MHSENISRKLIKNNPLQGVYTKWGVNIISHAKSKMLFVKLQNEYTNLCISYKELVSQKLKDANMFIFLRQEHCNYYGIDLDNTFTLPYTIQGLKKYHI